MLITLLAGMAMMNPTGLTNIDQNALEETATQNNLVVNDEQDRPVTIEKWMSTRWSADALAGRAWKEYPRPQMVRDRWENLNGSWEYAIAPANLEIWPGAQGKILVPYPVQSHLSGVQKQVYADQALWYRRTVVVPDGWKGQRLRLNFGAVDWHTKVLVNGKLVGEHFGGYDPFGFDITDALKAGENELVLRVWDPTTDGDQPYGKQTFTPSGIWYTAVTGIWQTVWMEPVSTSSIALVVAETKISGDVKVDVGVEGKHEGLTVHVKAMLNGAEVATGSAPAGKPIALKVPQPRLWSPDSPTLYDLEVELRQGEKAVDKAGSYFGIREIALKEDKFGVRTYLNGEPIFMFGPLDQGWWPDGLYTPPSDDALRYDLEVLKRAGFNTVRKHVKVEPARFYRHCDELGLLVWQDMPSNLKFGPGWNTNFRVKNEKPDGPRPAVSKQAFEDEWRNIMTACKPFPSVVVWVPFNEAWGQFDTKRVSDWTKAFDPSRLVNPASGGNFVEAGDMLDIHVYPGPGSPDPVPGRAIVLGEFGGLGLPVDKHTWQEKDNWGYRSFTNSADLMVRYEQLIKSLTLLKSKGLSAAIYTQTTDVEIEVNGLMTYDRSILKMPLDWLRKVNSAVYGPPMTMQAVLPTADDSPGEWSYTESEPAADWFGEAFSAVGWKQGKSGFGTAQTPGAIVGTVWSSEKIWIRREFTAVDVSGDLWLKIHHDEDAVVYLNGSEIARLEGYTTDYLFVDIPDGLLRSGKNVIAVSCKQTSGGQYIDAGFYRAVKG
ncbi:MAG: hypothetical protein KF784_02605 [Fimbriimonadaceae bacterium]|nr:hypothetical protein [Fimbriimonadaceae bacterium]